MQRVQSNDGSYWPLAFLVYQKRLLGHSMTKVDNDLALIDQTSNTSAMPLRALDPKEKSKDFPFYFGPTHCKQKHPTGQIRRVSDRI